MSKSSLVKHLAQQERLRRKGNENSAKVQKLLAILTPVQRRFVQDPSRFKLVRGGRRGGKTMMMAAYHIIMALSNPKTPCLYLGLTRESAKEAIWPILILLLEQLRIPFTPVESRPMIKFPNGSFILLFGADTPNARNRLRGRKFKLITPDEMGFFLEGDALIKSLIPSLADLKGTLAMGSSPGERLSGFFYDADVGQDAGSWSRYSWNLFDNPLFQRPATDPKYKNAAEEELDTICRLQYGGNRNHPAFRREYLNEWVKDGTSLVYPYSKDNVIPASYELNEQQYGIGIDLGSTSASAIVVMKFSRYHREVQIVEDWAKAGLLVDDLAAVVLGFIDKYKPTFVVADTGGLGKVFVEEWVRRYHMPIEAADKPQKSWYQRIMANDLVSGYIKVVAGLGILQEWDTITKDVTTGEELPAPSKHRSDAALYIYKRIYSTILQTVDKVETEEDRMIAQLSVPQEPWYERQ